MLRKIIKIIRKSLSKFHITNKNSCNKVTSCSHFRHLLQLFSFLNDKSESIMKSLLSFIKDCVKLILYESINFLISPSKTIQPKSILLIRLDAIGDYILFRNFIEILKTSDKYKDYSITLVGNIAWRELSETLDGKFIDRFIWINTKIIGKNLFYRYKKFKEITSTGYEVVIAPVYSRDFFYTDAIVKIVNAREKIGSEGDLTIMKKWQKKLSDKYYTKLIPAKTEVMFEFYRNKEFFENLLGAKIIIKKPFIKLNEIYINFNLPLPENYALIFIGASASYRKWNMEGFAEIAKYLRSNFGYEIVLCGSKEDIKNAKLFAKYYGEEFINLVGKTSLLELLIVISKSSLVLSNETSVPHMAVALDIKNIFVIYNGRHYGRFTPYPKEMVSNYCVICHPEIESNPEEYKKLSNRPGYVSKLNINEITVDMVKEKIEKVLRCS